LAPASDCGDYVVGVGDPLKGFAVSVVIVEEAVDGGLKVDDGSEDAALQPSETGGRAWAAITTSSFSSPASSRPPLGCSATGTEPLTPSSTTMSSSLRPCVWA
jgi:hypothetical protein